MAILEPRGRPFLSLVGGQTVAERFYLERARSRPGVLVLGCSNAALTFQLCAAGAEVIAVDPSETLIAAAEDKRDEQPSELRGRVELIHADLRAVRLEKTFPFVVAAQNAVGLMSTLEDLDAFLSTARAHLTADGTFAFDTLNPNAGSGGMLARMRQPPASILPARAVFSPHLHERQRRLPHGEESALRRLRLRQFSPEELDAALGRSQLVPTERYGNFEGKPFEADDALQIVVATPA